MPVGYVLNAGFRFVYILFAFLGWETYFCFVSNSFEAENSKKITL